MNNAARSIEVSTAESSWKSVPLGELAEILDNKRKPMTKRDRIAGPYPYYGATGVLDRVSAFLFDEPLVLIGEDGAKWAAGDNSAFPISGKTWVNNHAHVLRPRRDRVLDDWLIYYLNATDLSDFISGMTVPKLNQGRLREIPVPLPPLDEQKRIVAVLDQAFAALDRARAHVEANLAASRLIFARTTASIFQEVSSTHAPELPVAQIAEKRKGSMRTGPFGSQLKHSEFVEVASPSLESTTLSRTPLGGENLDTSRRINIPNSPDTAYFPVTSLSPLWGLVDDVRLSLKIFR